MTPAASVVDPASTPPGAGPAPIVSAQRITFVISSLVAGGAERVLVTMAEWWSERGLAVTVIDFAPPDETPFYQLGTAVHEVRLGLRRTSGNRLAGLLRNLRRGRRLRAALRASRPDIVISFMDKTNVLVLLSTIGWSVPVVVEEHADPAQARIGWLWDFARAVAYRRAAALVTLTPTALAYFPPVIRARGRVIANPIKVDGPPRTPSARLDGGIVVAVGRLGHEKGFDLLIEAFGRVAAAHPGWDLEIWGEGSERPRLERMVATLGLGDRVRLPGQTTTPFDAMRRADLFVLSSRQEGFGNVLVEAMAVGLPVISFDCPSGPRHIIHDGLDGLLVPAEDVTALAAAMARLMDDAATRDRLAAAALEVRDRFDVSTIMGHWDRLTTEVLRGSGPT